MMEDLSQTPVVLESRSGDEKKSHPSTDTYDVSSGRVDELSFDDKEDRKLTNKLDRKVIPILGLLYLICFLDRTNIANAKLAGLEEGLNMPSNGYNTTLWIFYIPFVLAEVPSNMIMSLPKIRPNLWLGGQTLILGILAMCQGLTHTYPGLLGIRFLMGIVETGLPAGAGLLLASYYRKSELSLRYALFLGCGEAGACFSGLLAYALEDLDGTAGYAGWRWILIVEGLITIFFSFFVLIFCPNFPARDKWIKPHDKTRLLARLEADKGEENNNFSNVPWIKIIFDYRVWLLTLLFFCADMSAGSISSFNPTILSQLGWTSRRAQVMTIPVWVVGIFGALAATLLSGKLNTRWPFISGAIFCSVIGWTIHYCQVQPPAVRYFAQFLIALGTFVAMPLYSGWLAANLRGRASLSYGTAVQFGFGNCANFISSNVFISAQAPTYPVGFGTGLGITVFSFGVLLLTLLVFSRHNKNLEKKRASLPVGSDLDDQVDYEYVF